MEAIIYPFRTKSGIFVEKLKLIIWTQVLFSLLVSRKVISHVSVNEKKKMQIKAINRNPSVMQDSTDFS